MSVLSLLVTAPLADPPPVYAGNGQLVVAALVAIAVVVVLISALKVHPFLALILGSAALGAVATMPPDKIVTSFTTGFGSTTGSVGLLIALGAMVGKLLADTGGADTIVNRLVEGSSERRLPWVMAIIAAILGLPLFFEVGVVLLVPVVIMVARRTGLSMMKVGIPALAGLSILHGLVPPHPGPLVAIDALKADLGLTLLFGLIVAVPTLIVAGPLLARFVDKWVPLQAPSEATVAAAMAGADAHSSEPAAKAAPRDTSSGVATTGSQPATPGTTAGGVVGAQGIASQAPRLGKVPAFGAAIVSITLPVLLMLARSIGELTLPKGDGVRSFLTFLGTPSVALLLAVIFAFFALGKGAGLTNGQINSSYGSALPGIAAILLIVAAGGGFKQTLVDAGVGRVVGEMASGMNLSPLVLGFLVAVGIRLATGSATVATITAAGIVSPLAAGLSGPTVALLVLAIGAGSLFFSHVNDAGFWMVKQYFGMTVGETIKSWSVMETVISVVAFLCVMIMSVFIR